MTKGITTIFAYVAALELDRWLCHGLCDWVSMKFGDKPYFTERLPLPTQGTVAHLEVDARDLSRINSSDCSDVVALKDGVELRAVLVIRSGDHLFPIICVASEVSHLKFGDVVSLTN